MQKVQQKQEDSFDDNGEVEADEFEGCKHPRYICSLGE